MCSASFFSNIILFAQGLTKASPERSLFHFFVVGHPPSVPLPLPLRFRTSTASRRSLPTSSKASSSSRRHCRSGRRRRLMRSTTIPREARRRRHRRGRTRRSTPLRSRRRCERFTRTLDTAGCSRLESFRLSSSGGVRCYGLSVFCASFVCYQTHTEICVIRADCTSWLL